MPTNVAGAVADVADDVAAAAGAAVVDGVEEDTTDEETFLGNFKLAFLLMLDKGLKILST